ncbi:nucleotidyltransferase [Cytobacillus purgationiresistens]|uniref:tRNA(Met) cytidine acetate ligase n=1 Tax=Cytobacillus purgationiresistens TaxID=863449 RepID=A0ABU0AMY0_9BACI|nr:nucleotidyltransferase [Cytobacillus purgationiresistens]MDQ0272385.1 putative nucleotidyltransferase [Cytobacillus purgationiresistens]
MKAVGVVVEYNPFHNGHSYHLQEAKKHTDADVVIAVMSGNFLQRGEPALVSKWSRTKMALQAGCDIVIELPYQFATQQANSFASGAVSILEAIRCEYLCFGSESGDIGAFLDSIHFLEEQDSNYQQLVKKYIDQGNSYPKASSLAYQALAPDKALIDLTKPNNILGFQYIKAIQAQNTRMKPVTIGRKNADYHDEDFTSATIASATSLRKALFSHKGKLCDIQTYVPETTYEELNYYYSRFGLFHHWENYWPLLKYRLLHSTPDELRRVYEVEEGIENRFLHLAWQAESFKAFMEGLKTKRYTWTRLQRICVHILTNTLKEEMQSTHNTAEYLRLLGMTDKGREYLNKNKTKLDLPLISRITTRDQEKLALDIKASRIYALAGTKKVQQELLAQDFKQPPIIISS